MCDKIIKKVKDDIETIINENKYLIFTILNPHVFVILKAISMVLDNDDLDELIEK